MKFEMEEDCKRHRITRREFMEYSALFGISAAVSSGAVGFLSPKAYPFSSTEGGGLDFVDVKCVKVSFTNCFLIPCDGGYLQIDVSYPKDYDKYLRAGGTSVEVKEILKELENI